MRVLTVFGTRPEALKMVPVVRALKQQGDIETAVCVTGQHRELLDQVLVPFGVSPDFDLDVMQFDQTLCHLTAKILTRFDEVLDAFAPHWIVVQGDTTTALTASLAAFYRRIPVAHVEAGLRTGDIVSPFPEELNRRCIDQMASILFAPTEWARQNLLAEGMDDDAIEVTGNTAVDMLRIALALLKNNRAVRAESARRLSFLSSDHRLILVTGHRRENFGENLKQICLALQSLAKRTDVQIVYCVHPNPNVKGPVNALLGACENIHLIEPPAYLDFVTLMQQAAIILTDSGGIQEEAPYLRKPVLVTRANTERPEAVEAGFSRLVGAGCDRLLSEVNGLLDNQSDYAAMVGGGSPFGDGHAADRIVAVLSRSLTSPHSTNDA